MLDAREQIRKMNIVSVKDKEDKKEDSQEEKESPADKVLDFSFILCTYFSFLLYPCYCD